MTYLLLSGRVGCGSGPAFDVRLLSRTWPELVEWPGRSVDSGTGRTGDTVDTGTTGDSCRGEEESCVVDGELAGSVVGD